MGPEAKLEPEALRLEVKLEPEAVRLAPGRQPALGAESLAAESPAACLRYPLAACRPAKQPEVLGAERLAVERLAAAPLAVVLFAADRSATGLVRGPEAPTLGAGLEAAP
jgi:hypothetical protein